MVILMAMNYIALLKQTSSLKKLKRLCWEYVGDWQVQHPDSSRPNPRGCGEDCRWLLQQGQNQDMLSLTIATRSIKIKKSWRNAGVQIFKVASTNKILRFGVNADHLTRWPRPCSTGEGTWHQINVLLNKDVKNRCWVSDPNHPNYEAGIKWDWLFLSNDRCCCIIMGLNDVDLLWFVLWGQYHWFWVS